MRLFSAYCFVVTIPLNFHRVTVLKILTKHDFISSSLLLSSDQAVICMLLDRKKMWRIAARLQYTIFFKLFQGYGTPNFHSYYLLKHTHLLSGSFLLQFSPIPVRTMTWYSAYCFEATVYQFLEQLLHIKQSHLLYTFCYPAVAGYHAVSAMFSFNLRHPFSIYI